MTTLVVGGDSRLSKILIPQLKKRNIDVFRTTRRRIDTNDQILLNFDDITRFTTPKKIDSAVIVGGVTDYSTCESNYAYAHFINCIQIPTLIGKLLNDGIYVCFISTNTVFSSTASIPKEFELHNPSFAYASLKSIAEHSILTQAFRFNKSKLLSILRLTKNVSYSTSPFDTWVDALSNGEEITAFNDLFFAPILFSHSVDAIYNIISSKLPGMFHLSGITDISYADFAKGLIHAAKLNSNLVKTVSSRDVGVSLIYSNSITCLDMEYTTEKLGLNPIHVKDVYKYLISKILLKKSI